MALKEGQEAHWEVTERILFIYYKLNPGQGYVQVGRLDHYFQRHQIRNSSCDVCVDVDELLNEAQQVQSSGRNMGRQ